MPQMSSHDGEEFIYVLEGVVTFVMENKEHTLYPGDSIHIRAKKEHCCVNRTGLIAKYLVINMSNPRPDKTGCKNPSNPKWFEGFLFCMISGLYFPNFLCILADCPVTGKLSGIGCIQQAIFLQTLPGWHTPDWLLNVRHNRE